MARPNHTALSPGRPLTARPGWRSALPWPLKPSAGPAGLWAGKPTTAGPRGILLQGPFRRLGVEAEIQSDLLQP